MDSLAQDKVTATARATSLQTLQPSRGSGMGTMVMVLETATGAAQNFTR